MYTLFLDESGDPGEYRDENGRIKLRSSRFFTLAGIVVDNEVKEQFHKEYANLISKYFAGIDIGENFKLHFNKLRMVHSPFDELSRAQRLELENDVFTTINKLDCQVMSVTIDLDSHCERYPEPSWPTALALWYMVERFQHFINKNGGEGVIVFEKFTNSIRDRVQKEWNTLGDNPKFPKPTGVPNLDVVRNGTDPHKEPILAYADFFAYIPWSRKTSIANWKSFRTKYYDFDAVKTRSGNV